MSCEDCKSLEKQLQLVTQSLKIAKAVAENEKKALIEELAAQRKYILLLEVKCAKNKIKIFAGEEEVGEAGNSVSEQQSKSIS